MGFAPDRYTPQATYMSLRRRGTTLHAAIEDDLGAVTINGMPVDEYIDWIVPQIKELKR